MLEVTHSPKGFAQGHAKSRIGDVMAKEWGEGGGSEGSIFFHGRKNYFC